MVTIKLSNKLYYSLITIAIILLISAGVYAIQTVAPGTTPNPGHTLATIAPPPGCTSGQLLRYVTIEGVPNWECINPQIPSSCTTGQFIQRGVTAWNCISSSNYVRNVEYVSVTTSGYQTFMVAQCPSGKYVLGGGCDASDSGSAIEQSSPWGESDSWSCEFNESKNNNRVYAICANIN